MLIHVSNYGNPSLFALFLTQNINKIRMKSVKFIKMFAEVDEFLCFAS